MRRPFYQIMVERSIACLRCWSGLLPRSCSIPICPLLPSWSGWPNRSTPPPSDPSALVQRLGITHPTLSAALLRLAKAGPVPLAGGPNTWLPAKLLLTRGLRPQARLLYGLLQLLPGGTRHFTYPELSHLTGESIALSRQGVQELEATGWLRIHRDRLSGSVHFALIDPHTARQRAELDQIQRRLEKSLSPGEALLWEYLNLLIDSQEYLFHSTMAFLVHPKTREQMRYDRYYYRVGVAFDWDGPYHQSVAQPSAISVAEQKERDLIKLGLSTERQITLLRIRSEDLSLAALQAKIGQRLPLRDLAGQEHVIAFLESISLRYRTTGVLRIRPTQATPFRTNMTQVANQ